MSRPGTPIYSTLVLLGIGTVLLFRGGPDYTSSRSIVELWNNGHILYFALLSGLALQLPPLRRASVTRRWLLVLGLTLLAGCAIELLQHFTGRRAQFDDLLRDLSGSLLVLAFAGTGRGSVQPAVLRLLRVAALLCCLFLLLPLAISVADEVIARRQFPLLADFETPFELGRWGKRPDLSITASPAQRPGSSLLLQLDTARYSGAGLQYFPGDWRGYRRLHVDFFNPDSTPLRLTCRVHDYAHTRESYAYSDRFNRAFVLHTGWNRVTIDLEEVAAAPAGRTMDMGRISGFGCHAGSLPAPRRLYLDNLGLSR